MKLPTENLKDLKKDAKKVLDYGEKRFDILSASISSAGIYVCLESIKYVLNTGNGYDNINLLKSAIVIFGISLVSSLTSLRVLSVSAKGILDLGRLYEKVFKDFKSKGSAEKYDYPELENKQSRTKKYTKYLKILDRVTFWGILSGLISLGIFIMMI